MEGVRSGRGRGIVEGKEWREREQVVELKNEVKDDEWGNCEEGAAEEVDEGVWGSGCEAGASIINLPYTFVNCMRWIGTEFNKKKNQARIRKRKKKREEVLGRANRETKSRPL